MNMRVNLMLPEEHQHTSDAAKRVLIRLGIMAGGGLLAAVTLFVVVSRMQTAQKRDALMARWEKVAPLHEELNAIQTEFNDTQKTINELNGLRDTGLRWAPLLDELRSTTPETVQLTKLLAEGRLRISWEPGDKGMARTRGYRMDVQGLAVGERGSEVVTEFVRRLPLAKEYAPWVSPDQVRLDSLQLDSTDDNKEETRRFIMQVDFTDQTDS